MNSKTANSQRAYVTKDAANYLGCAEITLKQSRQTGLLMSVPAPTYRKAGTKVIYLKEELDNWLNALPKYSNTTQEMVFKHTH